MRRTELKETKEHKDDFVIVERASPGTPKVLRDAPALLSKRRGVRMSKGSRRGGKGKKTAPPSLPPSLEVSPTYFAVFRFQANAVVAAYSVTASNVAASLGAVNQAANTLRPICSAFKIKRIIIWPPSGSASATGQNTVTWAVTNSGFERDSVKVEVMPGGVTTTRPLVSVPPVNSLSGFWTDAGQTGTVFQLFLQAGAVLDMHCDFNLSTGLAQFATVTTTAAGTLGSLYYTGLDSTTGKIGTLGRVTIT